MSGANVCVRIRMIGDIVHVCIHIRIVNARCIIEMSELYTRNLQIVPHPRTSFPYRVIS